MPHSVSINDFDSLDMIIICGLPKSGKSHFAKKYFSGKDRVRINRREIRKLIYEMTHFGEKWKETNFNESGEYLVKHIERKMIEHYLHNNVKVLIDNTSVTKKSRKSYISTVLETGKKAGVIFLNTPVNICLNRNKLDNEDLPEIVISKLYASIEIPVQDEGFSKLITINDYQ